MDPYDADTTGDHDENTLDGSEGLDAAVLNSDAEDLVVDAPDHWRGARPHETLDQRLAEEKPDISADDNTDEYPERDPDGFDGPDTVYDERLSMLDPEAGRTLGRD